jgi:hypothetical protein
MRPLRNEMLARSGVACWSCSLWYIGERSRGGVQTKSCRAAAGARGGRETVHPAGRIGRAARGPQSPQLRPRARPLGRIVSELGVASITPPRWRARSGARLCDAERPTALAATGRRATELGRPSALPVGRRTRSCARACARNRVSCARSGRFQVVPIEPRWRYFARCGSLFAPT